MFHYVIIFIFICNMYTNLENTLKPKFGYSLDKSKLNIIGTVPIMNQIDYVSVFSLFIFFTLLKLDSTNILELSIQFLIIKEKFFDSIQQLINLSLLDVKKNQKNVCPMKPLVLFIIARAAPK